jgi:hypothetical protein
VLGCIRVLTLFKGFCGVPMRFGGYVMVRGGFVLIVFWHFVSSYQCAFHWPMPRCVSSRSHAYFPVAQLLDATGCIFTLNRTS